MVFQIYFGERGMEHNVLFDIEVYLKQEERLGGDWYSEIISRAFGSAFTNYFFSVNMQELQELIDKGSYISDMVKDAKELEELRGWLYEIAKSSSFKTFGCMFNGCSKKYNRAFYSPFPDEPRQ